MKGAIAAGVLAVTVVAAVVSYKRLPQGQKNDAKLVASMLTGIRFDRM